MTTKKSGRYSVSSDEDFEPNSGGEVLKNSLGIKSKADIEALEEKELERTEIELLAIDVEHPEGFEAYILAIHAGLNGEYEPIKRIFKRMLDQSA